MNTSLQTHGSSIRPGRTFFLTRPQRPAPWGGLRAMAGWPLRPWLAIFLLWSGLAPAQSIDLTFNPGLGANGDVRSVVVQADGKVLIGGYFTQYNGVDRNRIARLNPDGSLDPGFNPGAGASFDVNSVAIQADGKILIGGNFTQYNGTARNDIARLNANGSLDTSFDPGLGASGNNSFVTSVVVQADGKILIGGNFEQYNGTARRDIARLNANGSLDMSFNPGSGVENFVRSVAIQADGKILIGGDFEQYNGTARSQIARLNPDGSLDPGFNPGAGASEGSTGVESVAVQADGKILIGGNFTQYNGTARNRIARLNADGSLDPGFNPGSGAGSTVYSVAVQADSKVLIGGNFTQYNGTARNRITRLNADGSLDTGFDPGSGANRDVTSVAVQADGKVLIGGDFTQYNGTARSGIARLLPSPLTLTGFVASPATVCVGSPVTFTATVGNVTGSYSYTLTNGTSPTTGTATSPTFSQGLAASGTGPQTFTLTVSNGSPPARATTSVTVTQCLTLTGLAPNRNERSAPANSNVVLTFNQGLINNAATLGGLRLFSAQRGGLLRSGQGGSASVAGNTLSFNPATNFKPGETVLVTSTTAIQGTGSARLSRGQVYGFTTGVGGTGRGNFTRPASNPNPGVGDAPVSVAVGDVDGDGDLDFVTANQNSNTVSVRLNDGSGNFTSPTTNPEPGVGRFPISVALGDVDGDGDLDLLTANFDRSTVSVRLNDGSGNFSAPAINPEPGVGRFPISVAVGDVDGDGDLDLLTANQSSATVSVRLNDGSGNFTAPATNSEVGVGDAPYSVALGDVDGDGDLDLLTANQNSSTVSVRLNDGSGNFTPHPINPNPGVGRSPLSVALGDVDGDGDLDLLCTNAFSDATVSVRLNNGEGNFTVPATNPEVAVGNGPASVVLGDVDGDGDLDLLTANSSSGSVSVRLNNGTGNFTPPTANPNPGAGFGVVSVVLGDVDGDGDLDLLCTNQGDDNVSVRLNDPLPPLTLTGVSASPNPVCEGQPLSVTASVGNLSGSYSYTLSNSSNNPISGTATTAAFRQPLTATGSGVQTFTLTVSSEGQVATATTSVTVNAPPTAFAVTGGGAYCAGGTGVAIGLEDSQMGVIYQLSQGDTPVGSPLAGTGNALSFGLQTTPGSYSVLATRTNANCQQAMTGTVSVTSTALPTATLLNDGPITCAKGTVILTAGGGTSYGFSGEIAASGNSATVTQGGTYTVTVTANGCSSLTTTTVLSNTVVPTASINPSSTTLTCTSPSVSLTAVGTGSVRWDDNSTSAIRTVSSSGTYSVTVTGDNGCTASANAVVSADQGTPSVSISPSSVTLTCATPTVSLTAVGTGSVLWSTGSTNPILTVGSAGTYSVTLTSGSGCTASASAVVSADQNASSVSISPSSATLSCSNPTVSLTAVGTGLVRWSTGETTPVISVSVAGTYSVTLTGDNACMSMAQVTVSGTADAPSAPTLAASPALSTTNQPITVTASGCAAGLINWTALGGTGQASGNTYTLTQPGNYTLSATCSAGSCTSPASVPLALQIQPGGFAITGVNMVSCTLFDEAKQGYQVQFTPQYTGANSNSISFSVVNELATTTQPAPYSLRLYTDNPTITLVASQGGSPEARFAYNWFSSCQTGTTPNRPPTSSGIPAQALLMGQPYQLELNTYFTDPDGQALTYSVTGLPAGLSLTGSLISGTPSMTGVSTVRVTALDPGGLSVGASFQLTVSPMPVAPAGFRLVGVSPVSCAVVSPGLRRVTFTPQYAGLDGSPVSFSVVNEKLPTTEPGPYTLNLYTDNPAITLSAQQGPSVSTFVYNWLASCSASGRLGSVEPGTGLQVVVVGNPVLDHHLKLEVRGAQGQPLRLSLIDERGRSVGERVVEQAGPIERPTLDLSSQPAGVLLLRVSTPSQHQTVKVLNP